MAKDRILGSSAKIEIYSPTGLMTVEVDSFSANQVHTKRQWHPLGEIGQREQLIYVGWTLDFKTGKIDDQIASFFDQQDQLLYSGQPAPRVRVTETIRHFDGNNEIWIYQDSVLSDYVQSASNSEDEISETFKGACTTRIRG